MEAPRLDMEDTIVAAATPPGMGAVGMVRLSGPRAIAVAEEIVRPTSGGRSPGFHLGGAGLSWQPERRAVLAEIGEPQNPLDRGLVTVFKAPRSYTGEDTVEISCHGSPALLREVVRLCLRKGARLAEPGEFSRRAFLNGKMDLMQAEAVADLICAQTRLAGAVALSHLEGKLSRRVAAVRDGLVEVLAHLEVQIDHSDDDAAGTALSRQDLARRLGDARTEVRRLLEGYDYGRVLRQGLRVAIVGRPNAGKSSLLNALLKSDRAIVAPEPGTTRDTLEEGFDLLGISAVLVDTAGFRRQPGGTVEQLGIERTLKALEGADAAIIVLDSQIPLSEEDEAIAQAAKQKRIGVAALNKVDLGPARGREGVRRLFKFPLVEISALRGEGIEPLLRVLREEAMRHLGGAEAESQEALVCSLRHRTCLEGCAEGVERALQALGEEESEEILALAVREALDALGRMTGEVTTEDLLREIFSRFCIGK